MNQRTIKKLRKMIRKEDGKVALEFKIWVNKLKWKDRVKLCWRIIWKAF